MIWQGRSGTGGKGSFPVRFYRTTAGGEPVREWIRTQARDIREAIGKDIRTVQDNWPLGMPMVRALGKGLFEIRIAFSGNAYRVMFIVSVENMMVLLHSFQKKTRATPKADLDLARRRQKKVTS